MIKHLSHIPKPAPRRYVYKPLPNEDTRQRFFIRSVEEYKLCLPVLRALGFDNARLIMGRTVHKQVKRWIEHIMRYNELKRKRYKKTKDNINYAYKTNRKYYGENHI